MDYKEAKVQNLSAFTVPKTIRIDPTNVCNRACKFCGHYFKPKEVRYDIKLELIQKVSIQLNECLRVILGFNNEPLLHPNSIGIIELLRKHNSKLLICMITNGDKLRSKYVNVLDLFSAGLNVMHINLYDDKSYIFWKEAIPYLRSNGILLKDYYRENFMYNTTGSKHKVILFCDARAFTKTPKAVRTWHTYGGTIPMEFWRNLSLEELPLNKQCVDPLKSLNINSNGNVPICCRDMSKSSSIGNVNLQTIKDIWQGTLSRTIQYILKAKRRDLVLPCYFCTNLSQRVGLYPYIGEVFTKAQLLLNIEKIITLTKPIEYNLEQLKNKITKEKG